ncbi:hypothetical protein SMICM304S_06608 [Streptomyces microflavus]
MDTATPPGSASLTFRDATDADAPALVALIESAYRGDSSRTGWTTEADLLVGAAVRRAGRAPGDQRSGGPADLRVGARVD